jgi:hypothetical protein
MTDRGRFLRLTARLAALLGVVALLVAGAALAAGTAEPSSAGSAHGKGASADLSIETSQLVENVASTRKPTSSAPDGAFGPNSDWEKGQAKSWNVAFQRVGESDVIYGIVTGQRRYINEGLRTFNWALSRQAANGSFPTASSTLYQYGMFVAAASRSMLMLQNSRYASDYRAQSARYSGQLHSAALYMASPAMLAQGATVDHRNTHRWYINALAFTLASRLSGDHSLMADADAQLTVALNRQRPNGVNPEDGGHDASYQALGIYEAEQWLVYERGDSLAGRVRAMVLKGLSWEASRISKSGQLTRKGDTRTDGQEISPFTSTTKGPSYITIVRALSYWAVRNRQSSYGRLARAVALRHLGPPRGKPAVVSSD